MPTARNQKEEPNKRKIGKLMQKKVVVKNGLVGDGVPFERIRRITGYLVGDISRWNNGKKAELEARVKHGL